MTAKPKKKPAARPAERVGLPRLLHAAKKALRECATTAAATGLILAIMVIAEQFTYRG
jgi:hypothetical protein